MEASGHLKPHNNKVQGERFLVRPLTESDWDIRAKWNRDPEILYFSEGDAVTEYSLEQVKRVYRCVSQSAFCFIVELDGAPIGECWLQHMNLERILAAYQGQDCRRIDLMLGEKALWGHGIGTEVVRLLCQFGFESEKANVIFACEVADYNARSLMAFRKAGFELINTIQQPPADKALCRYDLILTRERWDALQQAMCSRCG